MSDTDLELLARYARQHAEDAFAEIVRRHLDLVYSAALRQVRFPQLAEEVAQSAFTDLARNARRLAPDTVLTAWLYQVARRTAIDVVRRETRRQLREQIATEMNAMNATASDWTHVEPLLDEAVSALDDTDRAAVLLRYFANKSLREVGQQLGISEDAAQKRVSRAVERLRESFAKRGVTVGASGLVAVISANAVQAAPVGLAATISTAAALAGTTIATTATATQAIAMTTLQKTIVGAALAAAVGTGIYEGRQASTLQNEVQTLQKQQAPLAEQLRQLTLAHDEATNQLAALLDENERLSSNTSELLKLRGEVGRLREDSNELSRIKTASISPSGDPLGTSLQSWLERAKLLKRLPEQWPDKAIPELQLLNENDWLDTVRHNNLENEPKLRRAMSHLRETAKRKFAYEMGQALRSHAQVNNGQLPTNLSQLKPYFNLPVDDILLQRYQLLRAGSLSDVPSKDPVVAEIAPVDRDYDTLYKIGVDGCSYQGIGELDGESGMTSWGTNSVQSAAR